MGVLEEIQQGLFCRQYVMADGRIAMEHELVMCPVATPWRHPSSVPEHEFQGCVARIKAAHDAAPETDPRRVPSLWTDICQLMGQIALKSAIENERKMVALMETSPSIPPA
jgi:hypothetical protein